MDRLWPTLVVAAVVILVFAGMWWGWRRRTSRDAAIVPPQTVPTDPGAPLACADAFYVATTHHDRPLDRAAVAGLGFRAKAGIEVYASGVSLVIPGEPRVFLAAADIVRVAEATWAIDRVVERDGLVLIAWRSHHGEIVDSYLRIVAPADHSRVLRALTEISSAGTPA